MGQAHESPWVRRAVLMGSHGISGIDHAAHDMGLVLLASFVDQISVFSRSARASGNRVEAGGRHIGDRGDSLNNGKWPAREGERRCRTT